MACPHEDHDIDVRTFGRCSYCRKDTFQYDPQMTIAALNEYHPIDTIVYSPTQACPMCGSIHPV